MSVGTGFAQVGLSAFPTAQTAGVGGNAAGSLNDVAAGVSSSLGGSGVPVSGSTSDFVQTITAGIYNKSMAGTPGAQNYTLTRGPDLIGVAASATDTADGAGIANVFAATVTPSASGLVPAAIVSQIPTSWFIPVIASDGGVGAVAGSGGYLLPADSTYVPYTGYRLSAATMQYTITQSTNYAANTNYPVVIVQGIVAAAPPGIPAIGYGIPAKNKGEATVGQLANPYIPGFRVICATNTFAGVQTLQNGTFVNYMIIPGVPYRAG